MPPSSNVSWPTLGRSQSLSIRCNSQIRLTRSVFVISIRHRLLGPIPIEIHIMDQVSKFRYIPPPLGRPWDPRRPGGPPREDGHDDATPTADEQDKSLGASTEGNTTENGEKPTTPTPTAVDGDLHVGPHGELYLRGHPNGASVRPSSAPLVRSR